VPQMTQTAIQANQARRRSFGVEAGVTVAIPDR